MTYSAPAAAPTSEEVLDRINAAKDALLRQLAEIRVKRPKPALAQ